MHINKRKILLYLKSNPHAMYEDIAKEINAGSSGLVPYHIKYLMDHGYLKRISKWHLTKQAAKVLGERDGS